jgi:glycosyltransferase involved in cell wall biosynthesis
MKVCYFGTYDVLQPRTRVILEGLRHKGIDVVECHAQLWQGTSHKIDIVRRPWSISRQLLHIIHTYYRLLNCVSRTDRCDVAIYAHLGQIDLLLTAWWFRVHRIPIVWDALVSLYDTVVNDRELICNRSFQSFWLKGIDWLSSKLADAILVDTSQNLEYWHTTYSIPISKLHLIPVGAEDIFAQTQDETKSGTTSQFWVLFFGSYIPLHGIETIVRAAQILNQADHINWILIGTGQERRYIDHLAKKLAVQHVHFINWVPYSSIPHYLTQADVCLGVFGATDKANRIVPNKAYQALAAGRPLVTIDTPAARDLLLRDGLEGALLISPASPHALADAILDLSQSPEKLANLAQNGLQLHRRYYSSTTIGSQVADVIKSLLNATGGR